MLKIFNKKIIIFLFLVCLLIPKSSFGIYSMSAFYANVQRLVYSFVGAIASSPQGFVTNKKFSYGYTDAAFYNPTGVAVDSAGDRLYVVDNGNARIEKFVLSTGAFIGAIGNSTASGTCVSGAQTSWCTGGVFSIGSTDGMFGNPTGIVIDVASDFMYVADSFNFRVQKFVLSTGAFIGAIGGTSGAAGTCVSGKQNGWCAGAPQFVTGSGDGFFQDVAGIAIDKSRDSLFVLDTSHNRVQKFVLSTGAFVGAIGKASTAAGTCVGGKQTGWCSGGGSFITIGTADGQFLFPFGVAVDSTNDRMYITDGTRVQKFVGSTGAFVGTIGKGTGALGTCVAGKQSGWCVGGTFTTGATDGAFNPAYGITIDTTNNFLYILDASNNRIQKFTLSTGAFVGAIGNSSASGTCSAGAQSSWCTGGVFIPERGDGSFISPGFGAIDTTGNALYITDYNHRIQKINLSTGASVAALGMTVTTPSSWSQTINGRSPGTFDGMMDYASDVAIDVTNNFFYIVNKNNYRVDKFVLSTGSFVGSIGTTDNASGTCLNGAQTSWCTGGIFITNTSGDGSFSYVSKLTIDIPGNRLYVGDNSSVQKFNLSTGAFIGTIGQSTSAAGTCVVGKQSGWCSGSSSFSSGSADGQFGNVSGISLDTTNDFLYVADDYNRIQKFVLSTGAFIGSIGNSTASGTCVAGKQTSWCTGGSFSLGSSDGMFYYPSGLSIDISNDRLYVSDSENNRVQKFVLSTGAFVGAIGNSTASGTCVAGKQSSWCTGGSFSTGSLDGMFASAKGISIDTTNNFLYVADPSNFRIEKFVLSTGAFVGAIGNSTASGTCIKGEQRSWCTGGVFRAETNGIGFSYPQSIGLDSVHKRLYISDQNNVKKITW